MRTPIINISNLECAYDDGNLVLHIDELTIPRGKLVFIIGSSGIGKSTFLETLGLMNNTIKNSDEATVSFTDAAGEIIDITGLGRVGEARQLATHRLKYYSFLFQNTNLMPNLSAGENMCITQMLSGVKMHEAKEEVLNLMQKLGLDFDLFDAPVTGVSGGQRQRIAFIRAITAPFEILFGDEPTGNLDTITADKTMGVLKNVLSESGSTGIIVSHDIDLAQEFADMIVPIIPAANGNSKKMAGYTSNDVVLHRIASGQWTEGGKLLDNVHDRIKSYFVAQS
jgi:ABC-type lipoprotein export system ATPase subunit